MLDKVMISNKKFHDSDLIYEGAILIWNTGLPFLNQNYSQHCYQAYLQASKFLEIIQHSDQNLRINLHIELAKIDIANDNLVLAEQQLLKALSLDGSIPLTSIQTKYEPEEAIALYQRPYDALL